MLLDEYIRIIICSLLIVIALDIILSISPDKIALIAYGEQLSIDPFSKTVYIQLENSTLALNGSSGEIINKTNIVGDMIINPLTKQMFIVGEENLTVINLTNFRILAQMSFPNYATNMAIDQERNILCVVDDDSPSNLAVLNGTDMSIRSYEIRGTAYDVAVNPNKNRVYILDNEKDKIYVFDPERGKVRDNITIIPDSYDIVVDNKTNRIYVSSEDGSRIIVLDGDKNQFLKPLVTGVYKETQTSLSIDPAMNILYMGDYQARKLSMINTSTYKEIQGVPLHTYPSEISVDTASGDIFIFDEESYSSYH
jgi:DNA-binding beta-propeller fold protein YncE